MVAAEGAEGNRGGVVWEQRGDRFGVRRHDAALDRTAGRGHYEKHERHEMGRVGRQGSNSRDSQLRIERITRMGRVGRQGSNSWNRHYEKHERHEMGEGGGLAAEGAEGNRGGIGLECGGTTPLWIEQPEEATTKNTKDTKGEGGKAGIKQPGQLTTKDTKVTKGEGGPQRGGQSREEAGRRKRRDCCIVLRPTGCFPFGTISVPSACSAARDLLYLGL